MSEDLPRMETCPFCRWQGRLEIAENFKKFYVRCTNVDCQAKGPIGHNPRFAIKKWNASREIRRE